MAFFFKERIWEVRFETHQPLKTLPRPFEVVEEIQDHFGYCCDGRKRHIGGCQLQITLGGRGGLRLNGVEHDLTPGKAFLHNHDDPEVCYYYPENGTEKWHFIWIAFGGVNAEAMVREFNQRYGYIFELPLDRGVVKKLQGYRNYRGSLHFLTSLNGAKLFMDILATLGDTFAGKIIENPQNILVAKAQDHIICNLDKAFNCAALAGALQVSREHLSRVFKEQIGVTIHEYATRRKIDLAIDLLMQSNLGCKEIAERVGFNEYSAFSRAFRRVVGSSPQCVRENGYRPDVDLIN